MSPLREKLLRSLEKIELDPASDEVLHRRRMIELLEKRDCFHRGCFPGHFTGSALVLHPEGRGVLLHHHRFLDLWLQFGGHCDGEEDVAAVALREAQEESGLAGLEFVRVEPLDLDIHPIPANPKKQEPPHEHFDLRFLLRAGKETIPAISDESVDVRWFDWDELPGLDLDPGLQRLIGKVRALA
jgi:8-oxo-dGTP pyrophosphatase MutT (NUDIX family)